MNCNLTRKEKIKILQDIQEGKAGAASLLLNSQQLLLSVALMPKDEVFETCKALCMYVGDSEAVGEEEARKDSLFYDQIAARHGYTRK